MQIIYFRKYAIKANKLECLEVLKMSWDQYFIATKSKETRKKILARDNL